LEFIVIAILVVLVIGFIAYPLFTVPHEQAAPAADALDSLIAQRDSAYDAIRDLDFDFQLGKLSQADYDLLREKYKARAALALQQIDQVAGSTGAGERIEEEVARLRARRPGPKDGDAIEHEVARLRQRRAKSATPDAPANGHAPGDDDAEQEIARLRAARRPNVLHCRQCGTPYHTGDLFCSKCGTKL
jgi:hypothetical protein